MGEDCLVLFYSWSGNTRRVAQIIAQQTHGDLLELRPRHPYPEEYSMTVKRARGEIQKKNHPELCPLELDVANYKTLFVGTPNWCGTVAPPVVSFLKEFMPTEKNIIPFCTHGGGGGGDIAKRIAHFCIGCDVFPLLTLRDNGGADAEKAVERWLDQVKHTAALWYHERQLREGEPYAE